MTMTRPLLKRLHIYNSDKFVAKQVFLLGCVLALQVVSSLIVVSLSARMLGPNNYGALVLIISVTTLIHGILSIPGSTTATTYITRSLSENKQNEASKILNFCLSLSFLLSLVSYILITLLVHTAENFIAIKENLVNAVLLYGIVGIFLSTQPTSFAILRLFNKIPVYFSIIFFSVLIKIVLIVIAWQSDRGLYSIIWAHVIGAIVEGIGPLIAVVVYARRFGIDNFLSLRVIKVPSDIMKFNMGGLGKNILGYLGNYIDSIFVAKFSGLTDLALYHSAKQIVDFSRRPFRPIMNAMIVEYSKKWFSPKKSLLRKDVLRFTLATFILSLVGFATLAIFRQPIVDSIFGNKFSESASFILIMIPGSLIATTVSPLVILPEAIGKIKPSLIASVGSLTIFFIVASFLVPHYGSIGFAWANTFLMGSYSLFLIPFIYLFFKNIERTTSRGKYKKEKKLAKDFYLSPQTLKQYQSKFTRGRPVLDNYIDKELIDYIFKKYLKNKKIKILEIGTFTGRITKMLELYTKSITVSDTSLEVLNNFNYPKIVLNLAKQYDKKGNEHSFDAIFSIGHQVSLSSNIINSVSIFYKLLKPNGLLVFDVWNELLSEKYDPPYVIEKSSEDKIKKLLKAKGFKFLEYQQGGRLAYTFPWVFYFFKTSTNKTLFRFFLQLEKFIDSMGLLKKREQKMIFIAMKIK